MTVLPMINSTVYLDYVGIGLIVGIIILYRAAAFRFGVPNKAYFIVILNCVFLLLFKSGPTLLGINIAFAILVFLAVRFGSRLVGRRLLFAVSIPILLVPLFLFKYPILIFQISRISFNFSFLAWVGLSFITFRAIDLLLASHRRQVSDPSLMEVFAYLTFIPSLASGPLNRSAPFFKDVRSSKLAPLDHVQLKADLMRFCMGVIKILLLSRFMFHNSILSPGFDQLWNGSLGLLLLGLFCLYLYIYLELSGYTDCAIVVARWAGIRLPENFNYPLLATDLQDFWNRWHMSISHWFRDRLFYPLVAPLTKMFPKHGRLAMVVAIMVTFFVIGFWHGDGLNWLLYGLLHGLVVCLVVVWKPTADNILGERMAAWRNSNLGWGVNVVLTQLFVTCSLLLTQPIGRVVAILSAVHGF